MKQQKETLRSHKAPKHPWEKIGTDLFQFNDIDYMVTVDYLFNFWEVDHLENTQSKTVIRKLKTHFAHHGIPDILYSDNDPSALQTSSNISARLGTLHTKHCLQDTRKVMGKWNRQ